MPSVGRKFLLAGRGGLNLTHSEYLERFLARYGVAAPRLRAAIEAFPPSAVRGVVRGARPGDVRRVERPGVSEVLQDVSAAARLAAAARCRRCGLRVAPPLDRLGRARRRSVRGAARPRGDPSRCADFGAGRRELAAARRRWRLDRCAGHSTALPFRRFGRRTAASSRTGPRRFATASRASRSSASRLSFGGQSVRGESIVTRDGLEGGGIYALSALLRDAIAVNGEATLTIALRPDIPAAELAAQPRSTARQAIAGQRAAQGGEAVAARDRPAA